MVLLLQHGSIIVFTSPGPQCLCLCISLIQKFKEQMENKTKIVFKLKLDKDWIESVMHIVAYCEILY